jgi:hypothetical protein
VAVEEGDGGVGVGDARAAGIGQGVIGPQKGIIRQMDRKKIGVVLLVVPDWVRRRVDGGLGRGEGHAKSERG